ncbi:MAG TPA: Rieske 2Fe-2S domain-containing protein [Roseiflexaceae bacterium]|nr:Rieske 2Fe-2S domain-containing protein [Roseiflexaceae bacterium]
MKVPLIQVDAIPNEGMTHVEFFGRDVLVFKIDGTPKAIMNVCMHLGGPLRREDDCLVCEWHGAAFDVRDGHRLQGPARKDTRLLALPTRIEDGMLTYVYGE